MVGLTQGLHQDCFFSTHTDWIWDFRRTLSYVQDCKIWQHLRLLYESDKRQKSFRFKFMAIVIVRKWEMPEKFYFSGNLINQTENLVETFFYNFWRDVSKNGMS